MTNLEHNRLLSIFFYIQGGLQIFGGLLAALIYAGMGTFFAVASNESEAAIFAGLMVVLGVIIVALTLAVGGFYIFTARKMQLGASPGRTLGIVASALCLLNVPLGTALGVYGLWFLTGEKGRELYLEGNGQGTFPPPPPENWK
ncbi:MAG: hypothetical protein HKN33_12365 [Pyrinomonadaceae bacterium]|nr:hypothetical protein [Pyrinomonadaceae bacterium]